MVFRKITCVTFPRSGHHLVVGCLRKYFWKAEDLDTFQNTNWEKMGSKGERSGDFVYCEFHRHCRQTPCVDPDVNFQKIHDFNLKLQLDLDSYRIVQYRNPLEALISYYYFMIDEKKVVDTYESWLSFVHFGEFQKLAFSKEKFKNVPWARKGKLFLKATVAYFSRQGFMFLPPMLVYWKKFVTKWVIENKSPHVFFMNYANFVEQPVQMLRSTILFLNPDELVDENLILEISKSVKSGKRIKDFKYYDPIFFEKLYLFVQKEMDLVNLSKVF